MKKIIVAVSILIFLYPFMLVAQSILDTDQGGTGTGVDPKSGQLLIGTTAGIYSPAWLTAGSNITIATSSGGITISSTGGDGGGLSTTTPFTVGYIPYATSTSAITNSNIFQGAGGYIGIGTTSPAYILDVYGTGRFTGDLISTNVFKGGYGSVGGPTYSFSSDSNTGIYGENPGGRILFSSDGILMMQISGLSTPAFNWNSTANGAYDFSISTVAQDHLFYVNASTNRVGIGTTTPSALLTVGTNNQFTVDSFGTTTIAGNLIVNGLFNKFGTLTNTKWCTSDGTIINCTQDAPAGGGVASLNTLDGALTLFDTADITWSASGTVGLKGAITNNATTGVATLSSLTSIGTIGTGVWQGTPIAYNYGGTGTSTALANQYLWWGDGTGKLVQVASSTLAGAGGGGDSVWSTTTAGAYYMGNVGIGTSTPQALLTIDITGKTSTTSVLSIRDSTDPYRGLEMRFDYDQILIGINSGINASDTAWGNTSLGDRSLEDLTSGYQNVAIGNIALQDNTTGYNNVAVGANSLMLNTTGYSNTGVGAYSLQAVRGFGFGNTALGNYAGQSIVTGDYNVVIGYYALSNGTGSANIIIGSLAGEALTSGSNNIIIGKDIDAPSDTNNNQLNIGNLIFGTGLDGVDKTISTGKIGIATSSPSTTFYVYGSSTFNGNTYLPLIANTLLATDGSGMIIATSSSAAGVSSLHAFTGALDIWGTTNQLTVTASSTVGLVLSLPQNIHTGASPTFAGLTLTGLTGFLKGTAGVIGTSTIGFTDLTGAATDAQIPDNITITNNATTGVATLSSLSSVGTITTGTWNATPIAYNYGGTGTSTPLALQNLWWGDGTGKLVQVASSTLAGAGGGDGFDTAGRSLTGDGTTINADAELYTHTVSINITPVTTNRNPVFQKMFGKAITISEVNCSVDNSSTTIQFDERNEGTPNTAGTDVMSSSLNCDTDSASTTAFANAGIAARNYLSLDIDAFTGNSSTTLRINVIYVADD